MALLGALLIASALHGGVSLGVGTAYDLAGVRLEIGTDHFGAFGSLGVLPSLEAAGGPDARGWGFAAGLRWYRDVRGGFLVSLNLSDAFMSDCADWDYCVAGASRKQFSLFTLTAVV